MCSQRMFVLSAKGHIVIISTYIQCSNNLPAAKYSKVFLFHLKQEFSPKYYFLIIINNNNKDVSGMLLMNIIFVNTF